MNREETFWAVMERELQKCSQIAGKNVEVINFGQSGSGTTQELLALRRRAWKYQPDIVLLAFFTGNDVADNSRVLKQRDYHPYHVFQDGELKLDDRETRAKWQADQDNRSWGQTFYQWRHDNLRVSQLLEKVRKSAWEWWSRQRAAERPGASPSGQAGGIGEAVYREPEDDTWQEAWKVTEAVLLLMREEIREKGARFFVVVLTNPEQAHPEEKFRANFAKRLGVADLFYPDRRIAGLCRRKGIPALLLGPTFQEYATTHKVFFHGFRDTPGGGHWNRQGHQLAGEMIARWLCGQLN